MIKRLEEENEKLGMNEKIKALIPLHIFNPKYKKDFSVSEATRIEGVVQIDRTIEVQEGKR